MAEAQTQVYEFKELEKFQMFTDAPGTPGKRSRLVWSSYRGNPRISVFTGVQGDTGKGVINAPMNPETFDILMSKIIEMAKDPKEDRMKIECLTSLKGADGQRSQERVKLSDVIFGRDANGLMWLSVVAENRPKIKFEFRVSDFHKLYGKDGNAFTEADASSLQAIAAASAVQKAMAEHARLLKEPYAGRQQGGGASKPTSTINSTDFDDIEF